MIYIARAIRPDSDDETKATLTLVVDDMGHATYHLAGKGHATEHQTEISEAVFLSILAMMRGHPDLAIQVAGGMPA